MRSCNETLELISAALDGALTGEEQAALEEHLSNCPACSALFAELEGLHAAASQLEEVPAPAGFAGQVMARIAADPVQEQPDNVVPFPVKKRSRVHWKGWAATAAVVAVVALGAITLPERYSTADSGSADYNLAAPSSADNANTASSAENGIAKSFAYDADPNEDNDTGRKFYNITTNGADTSEAESANGGQDTAGTENEMQEEYDVTIAIAQPSPADYCGVLTLTGEPLPEELESYEAFTDSTGIITYIVPSDYFFSCLAQLEDQNTASFTYDASEETAAEYGLIIVDNS